MQYIWKHSNNKGLKKSILEDHINLTCLDLAGKQLSILPEELADYKQLTEVRLQENCFTTILPVLLELPQLTHLDLSSNRIKILYLRLQELKQLTHLNILGDVKYWQYPVLKEMPQLQQLTLKKYTYKRPNVYLEELKALLPNCEFLHA